MKPLEEGDDFFVGSGPQISPVEYALFAIASVFLLAIAGSYLDVVERVFEFAERYEMYEIDEILGALLLLPLASTIFFYLRNRRFRAAARHARELAGAILDGIPDAVTVSDAEGVVVYMNPAARRIVATTPWQEDFKGLHFFELYPEAHRETAAPDALALAERDGLWSGDLSRVAGDGREFPTADVLIAHKDANGELEYFSSISRDLSKRVELEQRLQQKQKLEAIGQLAGGIAHQYNNLLMVLGGHTRRAMKLTRHVPDAAAPLEDVLRAADIAAEMTRDLLLFTRRQPLETRAIRIAKALEDVRTVMEPLLDARYDLDIQMEDADVRAETDSNDFVQAMMNLAVNARDAMPAGGRIEIRATTRTFESATKIGLAEDLPAGDYVQISVKDEGSGIDDHTLEKLFEPFFTTKEAGKGTGLGLAMVLGLSESSGGTVAVESTPGVGSTFHIYLPKTESNPLSVIDADGDVAGQGETILLVEDNNELREIVAEMLDEFGYRVVPAAGGFDAIEIEQDFDNDIDLLLTDVLMPDISGPEVHRIIRQNRPQIPTLFISGYPGKQTGSNAIPEGARLLRKPIDPSDLARAIRTTLDEGPAAGAGA